MSTIAATNDPALDLYELGEPHTADSWLISDWAAGQTSNMSWSDDNVRVAADGTIELVLDAAPEGSSRPWEGGEIQSKESATTGTWSWTVKAPEMTPGAVFGMFTYKADWENQPWVEFDFEFVGADTTQVQLAIHMEDAEGRHIVLEPEAAKRSIIDLGFDAAEGFHTYEVSVTDKDATFYIDGVEVARFSATDMPGDVWQIGPMKSYVDLWSVSSGQEAWAGAWSDPGRPLVASISGADIRPGEYGSNYVPAIDEPVVVPDVPDTPVIVEPEPEEEPVTPPPSEPPPAPPVSDGNLLVNGSFDGSPVASGQYASFKSIEGWTAISGGRIEIRNDHGGVSATDGESFVDLDHKGARDGFYQDVDAATGQVYTLSFDMRAQPGTSLSTQDVEVVWNDRVVATAKPGGDWGTFTTSVTGGSGMNRLTIREVGSQSKDGDGALLDNFVLVPSGTAPISAPAPAPAPTSGETSDDVVTVKISGDAFKGDPAFALTVNGRTVAASQAVTADCSDGEWDSFVFRGDFDLDGSDRVGITFLNEGSGKGRSLYVDEVVLNGEANGMDRDFHHTGTDYWDF